MTQESSINFKVSFTEQQAHYADLQMLLSGFAGDFVDIKMPTWTPGSYLIREYSKNVESVEAFAKELALRVEKIAKNTWRVYHQGQDLAFHYRVYGFEVSVRTNFIDADHAFLSPAATFMYVDGHLDHPATVDILLPQPWKHISTGLPKINDHSFYASNFDVLFDSPLELGNQDIWHFEAAGVPHEFAMVGGGNYHKERLTQDITTIVEVETSIWGENPNDRYVFITHNYQSGSGGLEHLNSTVLGATRNGYIQESTYKGFLNLVAHEYFHLWNVKRLRPRALGPFDYETENYTTGLWIMEGFTAYYDNLIMRRCAFTTPREYLQHLSVEFNTVYNRPGYAIQPVGLSSFDAWIKQYRPDENSPNVAISYYNKGAMLAVALDTKIIAQTAGKLRLDNVLRAAYQQFYKNENRGFDEPEFLQLAMDVTGVDLTDIFAAVHSHGELDYNNYFNPVGFEIRDLNEGNRSLSLGIKTANNDTRILIKHVDRGSAAWDAGLNVDDEIIAVNEFRLDPAGKELEYILINAQENQTIDILVARDGRMRTLSVPLRYSDKKSIVIQPLEQPTPQQEALGKIWLSISASEDFSA